MALYNEPQEALKRVMDFGIGDSACLLAINPEVVWLEGKQWALYPVIRINCVCPLKIFEIFGPQLGFSDEILSYLRDMISDLIDDFPESRIIRISEWMMVLFVPAALEEANGKIIERFKNINARVNHDVREEYGIIEPINPQPSSFYVQKSIYKIGLR